MEKTANPKKFGRIRNQLILWFLLLGLVPLITVSAISYLTAKQGLEQSAYYELSHTSEEKERFIQNWFDYRWMDLAKQSEDTANSTFLKYLVHGLEEHGGPASQYVQSYDWAMLVDAKQQSLFRIWLDYDYIYDLFLIDKNGNILFTVVREDDLGTNLRSGTYSNTLFSEAVQHTLSTGEIRFSDFEYYGPSDFLLSGFLTAPLLTETGEIRGVFAVQIRLDRINNLLKNESKNSRVRYLVGKDGLLRSSIGDGSGILRQRISSLAFNSWQVEEIESRKGANKRTDSQQILEYIGSAGNEVVGLYRTISINNVTWVLISEIDKNEAFAAVNWIGQFELVLFLITGILIVLFSVNLSRRISNPLALLADASQNIIEGDLDQLVSFRANNEIGRLADVFNRMVKSRKRYEKELVIQSEERQVALDQLEEQRIALAQHAILATTDIKGTITYVNSKFEEISGYSEAELIGKNHRILNSGVHDRDFFRQMYLTISGGEIWNGEICNKAKNGELYWVATTIAPFKDDQGKVNRYIAIRTDITQQKRAQAELLHAKEAAEMAAKAKSEFLASMSHEIRTPMNGVLGMLGLLMRGDLEPDQQHQARLALSSAESLLVLINDILDFSKIEAGKLEIEVLDFDLVSMLSDFAEAMAQKAQSKGVEFMLDVSGVNQTMVRGDPGRIRQILTNLVSNAIKFTHEGEIIIKVDLVNDNTNQLWMSASVSDTGIGIPSEKLEHIFDSFTQVDASTTRQYGGTGLGLAIANNLCHMMEGDIRVESLPGQGSCFAFDVKLMPSKQSKQLLPKVDISAVPILVVDDNATNREVLRRQLQLWGADVTEASNAEQALSILAKRKSSGLPFFKVAFVDFQMPAINGAELGKKVRANSDYDQMKMIMMTSMSNRGDGTFFADIGFSGYFPKPATTSYLFDALAVILDGGEVLQNAQPLVTQHYLKSLVSDSTGEQTPYRWPAHARILLVEDNFINQNVAMGILDEFQLSCETASNGLEAIEMLRNAEPAFPYTMILMDCQMPEMDGYEATQAIRQGRGGENYKSITIIAMTANAMKGDREKCLEAGMSDYMSKPISTVEMEEKLETWLSAQPHKKISNDPAASESTAVAPLPSSPMPTQPLTTAAENIWDANELLQRVRGKRERAIVLIDMFLRDVPQYLDSLNAIKQQGDLHALAETAHTIKGVAANLSAAELMQCTSTIEQKAKDNNPDAITLLDLLPAHFERLEVQLQSFKNTN